MEAINSALDSAQKERKALQSRISNARDLASLAAGTGHDEYVTREPEDNSMIAGYEREMAVGERRVKELDHQIAKLGALRELSRRLNL